MSFFCIEMFAASCQGIHKTKIVAQLKTIFHFEPPIQGYSASKYSSPNGVNIFFHKANLLNIPKKKLFLSQ